MGFAADSFVHDDIRARTPARLVPVDAWSSPGSGHGIAGIKHLLLPADRVLVSLNTLQHWLWQRLQTSTPEVPA